MNDGTKHYLQPFSWWWDPCSWCLEHQCICFVFWGFFCRGFVQSHAIQITLYSHNNFTELLVLYCIDILFSILFDHFTLVMLYQAYYWTLSLYQLLFLTLYSCSDSSSLFVTFSCLCSISPYQCVYIFFLKDSFKYYTLI